MKKICLLVPTLNSGGIEMYVLRFLRYCKEKEKKLDITIIVKNGDHGVLYDDYVETRSDVILLKTGYINIFSWIRIYNLFKKIHFETICDFTANFAGVYLLLGKYAGIKNRIAFYRQASNLFRPNSINNIYNIFVNRLVYKYATQVLANSKASLNYFFSNVGITDDRFSIIYNGIDSRMFEIDYNKDQIKKGFGIPLDAIVVGHTGRFTWAKNFPVITQVAMRLYDNHDNVYFICCGSSTDTEIVKFIGKEKTDRIKLLGYRKDIPQILSMFDIFFFPSLTEGQPNSLLEALMAGLPVVASNIESIKEALPNDLSDQLIAPDNVDEAYLKIEELINDKDKRASLNRSEWAKKHYDADEKFEEFCNALIYP